MAQKKLSAKRKEEKKQNDEKRSEPAPDLPDVSNL